MKLLLNILFSMLPLLTGCFSVLEHEMTTGSCNGKGLPVYRGTQKIIYTSIEAVTHPQIVWEDHSILTVPFILLVIIDIPLSFVADTLYLPFDVYYGSLLKHNSFEMCEESKKLGFQCEIEKPQSWYDECIIHKLRD